MCGRVNRNVLIRKWATIMASIILPIAATTINQDFEIKKINSSGVVFEKIAEAQFFVKTIDIITSVKLPSFESELLELSGYIDEMNVQCTNGETGSTHSTQCETVSRPDGEYSRVCLHDNTTELVPETQCLTRMRQLRQNLNQVRQKEYEITHMAGHHHRAKRGMVDALGRFLHYTTGVMDNTDAEAIYKKLREADVTETKLTEIARDQLYVVRGLKNSWTQNINKLHADQNTTRKTIGEMAKGINRNTNQQTRTTRRLNIIEMADNVYIELTEMRRQQEEFLSIMAALQINKIHPFVLAKRALMEIHNKLAAKIHAKGEPDIFRLSQTYRVHSLLVNDTLLLKMAIPNPGQKVYTITKLYAMPMDMENQTLMLKIKTPYLAMDVSKKNFVKMNEPNFNGCRHMIQGGETKYMLCNQQQPLLTDKSEICEVQLTKGLNRGLQVCRVIKINRRDVFTRMYAKNVWIYSIVGQKKLGWSNQEHGLTEIIIDKAGTIRFKAEGLLYVDEATFSVAIPGEERLNILENRDLVTIPKITTSLKLAEHNRVMHIDDEDHEGHNPNLLEGGEEYQRWEHHIKELEGHRSEVRKTIITTNAISLSTIITICIVLGIVYYIRRRTSNAGEKSKNQKKTRKTQNKPEIYVEMDNLQTRRNAARATK